MDGQFSIFDYMIKTEASKESIESIESKEWNPVEVYVKRGSGFRNGKERIQHYFNEHADMKEKAEFIKKEYGIGGFSFASDKPETVRSGSSDAKSHVIVYNDSKGTERKRTLTHLEVAKAITDLIRRGEYL